VLKRRPDWREASPVLGLLLVQATFGRCVYARDFPGAEANGSLSFRTNQSLTLEGELGYLWRLPTMSEMGAGTIGRARIGLGGASLGWGGIWMFGCVHAFGCQAVSLMAEVYRPWWVSDWTRETTAGGDLTYALYLFRFSVAMYTPEPASGRRRYVVGVGLQLPY